MVDFTRLAYKRIPRQNFPLVIAALLIVIVLFHSTNQADPLEMAALPGQEVIGIYKLTSNEPKFLDDVFPVEYSANGSLNIHQAHVQGLAHIGALIHILDRCVCVLPNHQLAVLILSSQRRSSCTLRNVSDAALTPLPAPPSLNPHSYSPPSPHPHHTTSHSCDATALSRESALQSILAVEQTSFGGCGGDRTGRVLLLRRGPHLRTCAGAWGFLGEHAGPGETTAELISRAVREEVRHPPFARLDAGRIASEEEKYAVSV
jgi:hypothetical protein